MECAISLKDKPPYFPLAPSIELHQLNIDFEEPYRYAFPRRVWLYQKRMRILKTKLNECLCAVKPDITVSLLRRDINVINQMTDGSVKMGEIHFDRIHYRNFNISWLPSWLNTYIERHWMRSLIRELRQLSKFVVLTHEDAAFWPELQNVCVIPNPVSFFPDIVSDCTHKQVIAVGRYVAQKGFDRLIDALRRTWETPMVPSSSIPWAEAYPFRRASARKPRNAEKSVLSTNRISCSLWVRIISASSSGMAAKMERVADPMPSGRRSPVLLRKTCMGCQPSRRSTHTAS